MMENWMNHPEMQNIDPIKLELIKMAAERTQGKSGNSLASVLLTLITSARKKNIQFTKEEAAFIMEIMKEGKTAAEKEQIDKTAQMAQNFMKNYKK